ncbi:MAG: hypothetical protein M0R46_17665 [Candidatus Muirbacterium halophilum]|nr:hypothetical protein [Candidatus Muirbacterium halophilum]
MTNIEFIAKYPDTGENGIISLQKVGDTISIIQYLKRIKDYDSIKSLGLQDFMKDMRKCFGTSTEFKVAQREKKLKRILNI